MSAKVATAGDFGISLSRDARPVLDKVAEALRIILSDPNVETILINIFGGIVRCDRVAQGVIDALSAMEVKVPVVVRLEGTNAKEAADLLENSPLDFIVAASLKDGAEKAVKDAVVALDKAAKSGAIHPNNAARRKSRIMRQLHQAKSG